MRLPEAIGTSQSNGITLADGARWLFAAVLVGGVASGLVHLAAALPPPAGDAPLPAPPALLLDLAPTPEPEPEPQLVEPEPVTEPIPEPATEPEPVAEPLPQPEPVVEPEVVEPPEPVVEPEPAPEPEPPPPEPKPEPEPEPEPVSEPLPLSNAPLPVSLSAALQQQRQDTPATNFNRPRLPEPAPPKSTPATPKPAAAPPKPTTQAAPPPAEPGPSPQEWQQQVLRYLDRRKIYPREAQRAGQEGVVAINFTIDGAGRVQSVSVARSSGFPALDQAAVDTARQASPLPRPPASLGNSVSLTASIRFTIR